MSDERLWEESEVQQDVRGLAARAIRERDAARARVRELEAIVARVADWTHVYGSELVPAGVDTYGEGVRDCKARVARIIGTMPAPDSVSVEQCLRLADAIVRNNADTADLIAFATWIAEHPDVGDSLTAVEREREFQRRARALLRGDGSTPAPETGCEDRNIIEFGCGCTATSCLCAALKRSGAT